MSAAIEILQDEPRGPALVPVAGNAVTPMDMLDRAVQSGQPIEVLTKLMDLQERWDKNQARKAFFEAFAAFKAEAINVVRNKPITDGPLKGKRYAELFSFVDAVTPALSRNGLSASWDITKDEKDWIEVTCKIEHVSGHGKTVAMGGPPDGGGAKNAIQARVSTVTYLERTTLKAACGIAEQGDDHDGRTPGAAITDEQAALIREVIEASGDKSVESRLLKWLRVEIVAAIPAARYDDAMANLQKVVKQKADKP